MLRNTTLCFQAAVGRFGVSPYAVFLIKNAGNKQLQAPSIAERGRKCAMAWYGVNSQERKEMQAQAKKMPVFPQRRFAHPRRPPPFGRFVEANWHTTSNQLSFEDRIKLLSIRYALQRGKSVLVPNKKLS